MPPKRWSGRRRFSSGSRAAADSPRENVTLECTSSARVPPPRSLTPESDDTAWRVPPHPRRLRFDASHGSRYFGGVTQQAIRNALGVTVFGSHVLRVDPDFAVASVAITRTAVEPAEAFEQAGEASVAIRAFLRTEGVPDKDVQSSRVSLKTQFKHAGGEAQFIGHRATVSFQVVIDDLDRVETLLTGMVEGGADTVNGVTFQTRRLRELRAKARAAAVEAAHAKATNYATAASASLGKVLHIEDVNPDEVTRRGYGHAVDLDLSADQDAGPKAHDPGAIRVAGAVTVTYALLT